MYKIISLLAFLLFLSQIDSFSGNTNIEFNLEEEEYVNDIPFNTNDIINLDLDTSNNEDLSECDFEFGLKMIVDSSPVYFNAACYEYLSVEFQLEDEEYIDDIPFNTCDVIKDLRP